MMLMRSIPKFCSNLAILLCFAGISQDAYRAAVREGADIVWYCQPCHDDPVAESTRDGETSADILESEEFNPPVDSSLDQSLEDSARSTLEEPAIDESTVYDPPDQPTIDESAIQGPVPQPVEPENQPLTFQIVEGASERGKRKLIDSWGYSYNIKRQRLTGTDWQCTVRRKVRNLFVIVISFRERKNGEQCNSYTLI